MDFDDLDIGQLRARTGEKWSQFGDDVLPAWVADMDFPPPPPIGAALARMVELGDLGYPVNPGPGDLPTVFAERVARRYGWHPDPPMVEVITDVMQALYTGVEVYSEKGEGVVIQTPIYPPFLLAATRTERRAVPNTLVRGPDAYQIDFDALARAFDAGSGLLLFCNPHNPTGRAFGRGELEELAELVLTRDVVVIADEIHADLVYPDRQHIPLASLGPEIAARTVTLMSASKAFNIAGLRCAVAAFGSAELKRRFAAVPRQLLGGHGSPGLLAARVAWEECQDWLDAVLRYLRGNRDFVFDFVARELPGVEQHRPEATYLSWLDCSALQLEPDPFRYFLDRGRVALSAGADFGAGFEGFVRLNFATSSSILRQILERMKGALQ